MDRKVLSRLSRTIVLLFHVGPLDRVSDVLPNLEHGLKDDSLGENKSKSQSNQHIKYNVLNNTYIYQIQLMSEVLLTFILPSEYQQTIFRFNMKLEPQLLLMFNFIYSIIYICVIALTMTLACLRYIKCKT